MKHIGTRGGPMGDDELPTLDPRLAGLKGPELMRAAYELQRPKPTQAPRRARRPDPVSQSTPPVKVAPRSLPTAIRGTPADDWTPHDAIPDEPAVAHWADDIPIPDEPPLEEEWR